VDGIIGRVEVEDDLFGRLAVRLEKQVDEQCLYGSRVVADPVIFPRLRTAQLKAVERALARQRRAVTSTTGELARQRAITGSWRRWSWSLRSS
jgi:hypothetical protein